MATEKVKCPTCPVMLGPETTEKEHAEDCKFVIGVRKGIKAMKEGRTTPWSEVKRELGIEDSMATPTPIETLSKGLDYLEHYGHVCTVARTALEDVEALVVVLSKYPHQHDHRCYVDGRPKGVATLPVCGIPEALAKFQVKS